MYRTWVEISLARLSANYEALKAAAGGDVLVCPVLKADAYRHGAETVGRHLERRGARWMAVSNAQEGVELRQAGVKARILVMGDFLEYERAALADYDLTPVIHSLARLREYANFAGARREHDGRRRLRSVSPAARAAESCRHWSWAAHRGNRRAWAPCRPSGSRGRKR